ncbi:MAG: pantoate--beta-alanine ligase [Candidatus Eremiobacteraeota bacterium]|nr:pantoate--beta-alanine ligase [Candidatus Eremiobacteraeota bacterium]
MQIVRTPGSARAIARTLTRPVGFVPTMGALHAGHLALVDRAKNENATVVASIFVNPLQFGPHDDFDRYPRAFERDFEQLEARGVDLLYAPTLERMYPPDFTSSIDVGPLARVFEGARRPGHFAGVATVVAKLLHAFEPTSLYLGQKDVQQTAVLRAMVRDLDMATNVVVAPTLREADGLAFSSRNVYLTGEQRAAAPSIFRALSTIARAVANGVTDPARALATGEPLLEAPLFWDYLAIVDPHTFAEVTVAERPSLVLGVAFAGTTRLLDNVPIASAAGVDPVLTPPRPRVALTVARGRA